MPALLIILLAYLLGSVPFSYIVARIVTRIDIRLLGDGNAGAKNTSETVGFWAGVLVALLDIGKGALAVLLAQRFSGSEIIAFLAGGAVVLGHDFPIYLKFKGGQGMATMTGTFIVFMPLVVLVSASVFLVTLLITRKWDLSCVVGFVFLFGLMLFTRQSLGLVFYTLIMLPTLAMTKLIQNRQARTGQA
jgi:glycerol-3-phosphate acyltransferase PlsY